MSGRREVPDPTPVEVPLQYRGRPDEVARIKQLVRTAMSEFAEGNDMETFEEANDFDVEDDSEFQPSSPHEVPDDDPEFKNFSRDASLDDDGRREYLRRRNRGRPDHDNDDEESMSHESRDEGNPDRSGSRGSARSYPKQRKKDKGHLQRPDAGRHADADERRLRPYRDTASGEVIDPREFDGSD